MFIIKYLEHVWRNQQLRSHSCTFMFCFLVLSHVSGDTFRLESTSLGLQSPDDSVKVVKIKQLQPVETLLPVRLTSFLKWEGNTDRPSSRSVTLGGWCTRSPTTEDPITSWRSVITTASLTGAARTTPWAPCAGSASTEHQDRLWSESHSHISKLSVSRSYFSNKL